MHFPPPKWPRNMHDLAALHQLNRCLVSKLSGSYNSFIANMLYLQSIPTHCLSCQFKRFHIMPPRVATTVSYLVAIDIPDR